MMKKIVVALVVVFIVAWVWNLVIDDVELQSTPEHSTERENTVEETFPPKPDLPKVDKLQPTKTLVSEDSLTSETCSDKYQSRPEWKEIEAIISSIYMNGEEAAGQGVYQQMPVDAVKSYADAGDETALLHYGSEVMWKAAFGVYLNQINRNPNEAREELKKRVKQHRPNLDAFYTGADYAYRAAVKGKLGGIMEVSSMSRGLLRRVIRSDMPMEDVKTVLIKRHAYLNLMQRIHTNDAELLLFFSGKDELEEDLGVIFEGKAQDDFLVATLKEEIASESEKLLEQWGNDRARLGLPQYPDVIPERLELLLSNMERECG